MIEAIGNFVPTDRNQQDWEMAVQRFWDTKKARGDWLARNPCPDPDEFDDARLWKRRWDAWELDGETVSGPFSDAIEALQSFRRPIWAGSF